MPDKSIIEIDRLYYLQDRMCNINQLLMNLRLRHSEVPKTLGGNGDFPGGWLVLSFP
jgi:hypothetical protein